MNVIVYSHSDFDKFCVNNNITDANVEMNSDYAFISIIGTKQVIEDYLGEHGTCHYFNENHSNVLNLDFDDVGKDRDFNNISFKTISEEQARECVDFIESNLSKTFVIHCRAGKSRSQAFFRFIVDMYEEYKNCKGNLDNPCLTPNQEVIRKLKRVFYIKHNIYSDDSI